MTAHILFASREALCAYYLKKDLLYRYIPEEEKDEMTAFAWEKGRQAAERFKGQEVENLIEQYGIRLREREQGAGQIFSEFYQNKKQIVLNQNCIKEHFIVPNEQILAVTEYEMVRKLFLAHEFFHFLECNDKDVGIVFCQRKVITKRIGKWKCYAGVRMLSEIAAHSFTRHMIPIASLLKAPFDAEKGLEEKYKAGP